MEIRENLLKFKLHILSAAAVATIAVLLCCIAPSFLDVLWFFWPLIVSTAMFLAVVVAFDRISPPSAESPAEKAGEGLLEYVAGESQIGVLDCAGVDAPAVDDGVKNDVTNL